MEEKDSEDNLELEAEDLEDDENEEWKAPPREGGVNGFLEALEDSWFSYTFNYIYEDAPARCLTKFFQGPKVEVDQARAEREMWAALEGKTPGRPSDLEPSDLTDEDRVTERSTERVSALTMIDDRYVFCFSRYVTMGFNHHDGLIVDTTATDSVLVFDTITPAYWNKMNRRRLRRILIQRILQILRLR